METAFLSLGKKTFGDRLIVDRILNTVLLGSLSGVNGDDQINQNLLSYSSFPAEDTDRTASPEAFQENKIFFGIHGLIIIT
jgi:hypothetical protein